MKPKTKEKLKEITFKIQLIIMIFFMSLIKTQAQKIKYGTVKDIDGNVYKTIIVGDVEWMVENLATTRLNDGTPIKLIESAEGYAKNKNIANFSWYNYDKATYANPYGALYNWYAVNTTKLCPVGWRVPDNIDWRWLISSLGGKKVAGGKLKDKGIKYWTSPNTGGINEIGFTALPGGYLSFNGQFVELGINGYWWSMDMIEKQANKYNSTTGNFEVQSVNVFYEKAWCYKINNEVEKIKKGGGYRFFGLSVRCVRYNFQK